MKRYCLNSKARKQIKDILFVIFQSLASIAFVVFLCIFPFAISVLILLIPAYDWDTTVFAGVFIALGWLSLGIQQLGKWFITNLEEC